MMFFSETRFIRYLSKTIKYFSMDFDRFRRRYEKLHRLVLDQPLDEQEAKTVIRDLIGTDNNIEENLSTKDYESFLYWIKNDKLFKALNELTPRQQEVLKLYYLEDRKITEIARLLEVSTQAVSKSYRSALLKLRKLMNGGNKNEPDGQPD